MRWRSPSSTTARSPERADLRPARRDQPRRSQGGRAAHQGAQDGNRPRSGRLAYCHGDADRQGPYNNPDLRLALKYATDREQILKTLFSGYGTIGNDHPIPPTDPYFNKDLPQRKHDPEHAAFHFKKAGVTDPFCSRPPTPRSTARSTMGALFQASAGKAGIKVDSKKEPADGFWDNVWLKGAFVESYWGGRAAATQMLSVCYGANAPWNETHWKNEKFEKLLADARGETDEAKRKTYIWDMQAMLHEDGGAIIPVFRDWLDAHHDNVGGHTPHGGFDMDNGLILDKALIKSTNPGPAAPASRRRGFSPVGG